MEGFLSMGVQRHAPSRNFEILDSLRYIFLHFEVYFYFAFLFLEINQFEEIWRKKTEHLLKSIPEVCTIYQQKKGT